MASLGEKIFGIELNIVTLCQCLGSRSVGFARIGFLDPDLQKYQPKTAKKNSFTPNPKSELLKKKIKKCPDFWMFHEVLAKK